MKTTTLFVCLGSLLESGVAAFQIAPRQHPFEARRAAASLVRRQVLSTPTTTTRTAEAPFEDDDDDAQDCILSTSPASVFGTPIDQRTKDTNASLVKGLKSFLFDTLFQGDTVERAFARFYALETIARMPYFSYLSVLHLLETLGLWRRADYLKIHFAESWNELHHLLIMEELGGNAQWKDRWVAQHVAFFYYWIVVSLYLLNPTNAYNLNQAVEEEAYETYNAFLTTHADYLKRLPAPKQAIQYYAGHDLYLFDAMHHGENESRAASGRDEQPPVARRPPMKTLYDCFVAIRDDEAEHVKTMAHLQKDNSSEC